MKKSSPIYLWGFMGAGKTRMGKRLATKISRRIVDLDAYIEQKEQQTISELFRNSGEQYFRSVEQAAIMELSTEKDIIISCGGGTPCNLSLNEFMNSSGLTIYLTVDEHVLLERLWKGRAKRPLIAEIETKEKLFLFIKDKLKAREQFYSRANLSFDNTYPKTKLEELIRLIELQFD